MRYWILAIMLITLSARVGAYAVPYEAWMGAYVGESKVGYLNLKIDKAEFEGVQGYRVSSAVNNRLTVLGADLSQEVNAVIFTDSSYNPLHEEFAMSSGGKTTTISARFTADSIQCVISAGSGMSKKLIPIPKGVSLVGDAMFATLDKQPEIGKQLELHYFNPLTLAIEDLKVKVERRESITVSGKSYDAYVLTNSTPMGDMTSWQSVEGDIVRIDAMMGISMRRQPREEAMAGIGGLVEDFAVRTRVKADRPIPSPRSAKALDAILVGLDDPKMAISDACQKTSKVKGRPDAVRFRLNAGTFDARKSVLAPVKKAGFDTYLAPTPYVDSDAVAIATQAAEIAGQTKKAHAICSKIRQWVHSNMQVRADIGITRSASDVLKSMVGVCRDYATLFAALARANGIPARIVSGIVYLNDGFYYHAWTECWVGQWVPFDATMPTDFVDATHIKLAEGDATTMFTLAKVIGNLKAEIKGSK